MPLVVRPLNIPDVLAVELPCFRDERGAFQEIYRRSVFEAAGIGDPFVQDNISQSRRDVLRGLHYQKLPAAQGKLVLVIQGEIFDVAVDIRRGSPTDGHWVAITLKAQQPPQMVYVPPGFAHGFCVLSDEAIVLYKTTAEYAPALERGIAWNDPALGIPWPVERPILSPRDQQLPPLAESDNNFVYSP